MLHWSASVNTFDKILTLKQNVWEIGNILNLLWQILCALKKIYIVVNGQILNK